jgi:hypothetical protein
VECELVGETEMVRENQSQCQFVHHKFQMTWPDIEPGLVGSRRLTAWAMGLPPEVCYIRAYIRQWTRSMLLITGTTIQSFCLLAGFCWNYFFDPENGGDMFLRNVGWNSTDYTSYPRSWYSSFSQTFRQYWDPLFITAFHPSRQIQENAYYLKQDADIFSAATEYGSLQTLLHMRKVMALILGSETRWPDQLHGLPQTLQFTAWTLPPNRLRPLPSTSFPILTP